jgi:hypothetical protein
MALLTVADQRKIKARIVNPSRATAVANANNGFANAVGVIDVALNGLLNHRTNIHVLTIPPTTAGLDLKPKIGDFALVYIVDDAEANNPRGFAMYVYNRTVTAAGAVSGEPSWRLVSMT